MKKFKYPVRATGSKENLLKWAKELLGIGYECGVAGDLDVVNGEKCHYTIQYIDSIEDGKDGGRGVYIWATTSNVKVPYTINVDEEYDLALAIASQVDGNIPHVREWVRILGTGFALGNENFPKDALFRIEKITGTELYCHVDKESNKRVLGHNISYQDLNKATAEEIINHFRKNKTNKIEIMAKIKVEVGKNPFKKGDKVVFVSNKSKVSPADQQYAKKDGLEIGKEYEVLNRGTNGGKIEDFIIVQLPTSYSSFNLPYDMFELAINYKNNNMSNKTVVGYKLIKEYPGCPIEKELVYEETISNWYSKASGKGGTLVRNPENFPEIWTPIYEDEEKTQEVVINYELGDEEFTLKVSSKGYIEVVDIDDEEGSRFDYADLKRVLGILSSLKGSKWTLSVPFISIGCKENVSVEDLENLMEVYEELNNIK